MVTGAIRLVTGMSYPFRGAWVLLTRPGLKRWAAVPILLSILVFIGFITAASWVAAHYGAEVGHGWWGTIASIAAGTASFIATLLIGFFTFAIMANVVASPFNDVLSRKTEVLLSGTTGEVAGGSFIHDMLRAVLSAVKLAVIQVAAMVPALLLLLIPVIGFLLFAIPASFFLGMTFLDYPFERRKMRVGEKLRFCWEHFAEVFGFGVVTYALMLVPVVNVLVIPPATVGATMLYLALAKSGTRG
jgi:CysZ protein